jgi:DNA repair photolyase
VIGKGLAHGVQDLPWGRIFELVQKLDDRDLRDWYAARAGGWSRAQLQTAIATGLHERQGAARANFEWTEATWNPVTGCEEVSPGCTHCYAETFAERWRGIPGLPYEQVFALKLWPQRLEQPLKWSRPRMILVNSMSDLFHEEIPDAYIEQVFEVMGKAHWHTFQILTKRHERLVALASESPGKALA